ncbi:MAG TPA: PAS domain S-box protein [Gemmatimonadales bacterium]|nr:PAS domain S-box protein [Gemmatimonadales bacterium]
MPPDQPPADSSTARSELDRYRLVAIVESSDDGIISKDLDGTIRSWNPAAERIFGYTADEIVGQPVFRLIPPERHDEERALLARISRGEHIAHFETERIRKDGRRLRVSLSLSPLRDGQGRLIGASSIKRDVTAQRTLESQLQQAQRMEAVGRLAGGIAHDFNNLLTIIGGLTVLSAQRLPENSRERRDLEQVIKATERATALTQQLLTFSRRQVAEVEKLGLNDVVAGLESLLRRLIGEHIAFRFVPAHDLGRVRGNRVQLEQVIMNLAINGRDAMPEGGTLTITTENVQVSGIFAQEQLHLEPGPYVMLAVSDTGHGMDAVTQASIFEPFFTTKPAGSGTGLGLATVYAIVQQAGGAIYVYSEPGSGSVFKVYLPRVDAPGEAPVGMEPSAHPGSQLPSRGSILLVEDEPGVRAFAARVLEDAGYRVFEAGSGDEAMALLPSITTPISLLLTDVVMPGLNGRVLAERLRTTNPDVRVLYMSGYTDDIVVRAGVVTDGVAFIQKPFTPDSLLERVRRMLSSPAHHSAH